MEKSDQLTPNPRRHVLRMAIASVLDEIGFGRADKQCIESLTEVRSPNIFLKFFIKFNNNQ